MHCLIAQLQSNEINLFELCHDVCELDKGILGAAVLETGVVVAMYSKPDLPVPVPSQERFRTIFYQTHFIEVMHRSNEDFYGDLKFFSAHFSHGDVYSFPLDKHGYGKRYVLAFKIINPYSVDSLVQKVTDYLHKVFS